MIEQRRTQPIQWALVVAVALQFFSSLYSYGRLVEAVDDVRARVVRVERALDLMRFQK